jgi:hypothetical protein
MVLKFTRPFDDRTVIAFFFLRTYLNCSTGVYRHLKTGCTKQRQEASIKNGTIRNCGTKGFSGCMRSRIRRVMAGGGSFPRNRATVLERWDIHGRASWEAAADAAQNPIVMLVQARTGCIHQFSVNVMQLIRGP